MTAKEKTIWEQAIRVLGRNTVTPTVVETPKARRVPAKFFSETQGGKRA